jgi:hypothetical protein
MMTMNEKGRKIFCLGLSRTGTTSLHFALVACRVSSVHYPTKLAIEWMKGNFGPQTTNSFQAFSDIPVGVFFHQLHETHPNAVFIYTRRDPEKWLRSAERHFKRTPRSSQYTILRDYLRLATYGSVQFSRSLFLDRYLEHEARVTSYFKDQPEKLLTLDTDKDMGWEPILRFLKLENPDVPFPRFDRPPVGRLAAIDSSKLGSVRDKVLDVLRKG